MNEEDLELWKAVSDTVKPLSSKKSPSAYKAKYVSLKKKLTVKAIHCVHDVDLDLTVRNELKAGDVRSMDKSTAQKFKNGEVPLPSFWGGYRVTFDTVEFWQGRENRLHDRFFYQKDADGNWQEPVRLAP